MEKFVKMSLVAAVAISAFSSNASARTLADVAEAVDVFGYVQIRYDGKSTSDTTAGSSADTNSYTHKEVLGATGKINDDLSYMFAGAGLSVHNTDSPSTYDSLLMVYNYFTYTGIENTSISIGRQGLDTPLTVVYDPADATSEANGVSLTSKLGDITISAARFSSTDFNAVDRYSNPGTTIDGGEDYSHVGISGKAGVISLDAWYATMTDRYDTLTIGASAKVEMGDTTISPYARYTSADVENVTADQSLLKVGANLKSGIFGAGLGYGTTDEQGGWVTFDKDASANIQGWNISLLGNADADLVKANVSIDALESLSLSVNYTTMDVAGVESNEAYIVSKYNLSSSFSTTIKVGQVDSDTYTDKRNVGRADFLWLF